MSTKKLKKSTTKIGNNPLRDDIASYQYLEESITKLQGIIEINKDNIDDYEQLYSQFITDENMIKYVNTFSKTKKKTIVKNIDKLKDLIDKYNLSKISKGKLEKPINYNFTCSYVKLENIFFSQDTISFSNKYKTMNDVICQTIDKTPIKIVFYENNIYFIGYWGLEKFKQYSDENYHYSNYIPMIEVVNNRYIYTTINNRRLLTIYLLLNSLINNKYKKFKYLSNYQTFDIINDVKTIFNIDNIYIPVVIRKSTHCAPPYLLDYNKYDPPKYLTEQNMLDCYKNTCVNDTPDNCKWKNFLEYRYNNQKSWQWSGSDADDFKYGSSFIPYTNRVSTTHKVKPNELNIPTTILPKPIYEFKSVNEGDYMILLQFLFNKISINQFIRKDNNICYFNEKFIENCRCEEQEEDIKSIKSNPTISAKNAKERKKLIKEQIADAVLSEDTPLKEKEKISKLKNSNFKMKKTKKFAVISFDSTRKRHT